MVLNVGCWVAFRYALEWPLGMQPWSLLVCPEPILVTNTELDMLHFWDTV